jgi:hypothetical protein
MSVPLSPTPGPAGFPKYRISFFFVQNADKLAGWSESYYNNAPSVAAAIVQAQQLGALLDAARPNPIYLAWIRVQVIGSPRAAQIIQVQTAPAGGASVASPPMLSFLIQYPGQLGGYVRQWMHGVNTTSIGSAGQMNVTSTQNSLIQAVFSALLSTSNNWCLFRVYESGANWTITGIATTGLMTVPGIPANTWVVPTAVQILRTKADPRFNGIWLATTPAVGQVQLAPVPAGGWPSVAFIAPGSVRAWQKTVDNFQQPSAGPPPIAGPSIVRITEHKVGKVFLQYSGRRRTPAYKGAGAALRP